MVVVASTFVLNYNISGTPAATVRLDNVRLQSWGSAFNALCGIAAHEG